jgi:chemotaxis-related protein WspB
VIMLLLLFEVGLNRYGLVASQIVEVVPLVALKPVPHTPPFIAGLFNYRGKVVPVVDLSSLLGPGPARPLLSTRILLVEDRAPSGESRLLGLMAEHATETINCRDEDLQDSGVKVPGAPYLGPVLPDPAGLIQKISVQDILTDEVRSLLFGGKAPKTKKPGGEAQHGAL